MITNYVFQHNARRHRRKALMYTLFFHVLVLGWILVGSEVSWQDLVPDAFKEALSLESDETAAPGNGSGLVAKP
jgi:hypothetical protein